MANTKDAVHGKQMKILAVGAPGSGKTTAIRSLPGKKFALLFDPNSVESLVGADIEYEAFYPDQVPIQAMPIAKDRQPVVSKPWKPEAYKKFEQWYYAHMNEEFVQSYDWIIIDSYTSLANIMMDEIMALNRRPGRRPLVDDYGAVVQGMENLFRDLIPKVNNLYVTAHAFLDKDDLSGALTWLLQMTKGQMKNIPLLFTDIWCFQAGEKGGFEVLFQQDRRHPWIRSSLGDKAKPVETVTLGSMSDAIAQNQGIGAILKKSGRA